MATTKRKPAAPEIPDDPRAGETNRVFEITQTYLTASEDVIDRHTRMRVATGALEDNVIVVGTACAYVGLMSKKEGRTWSAYTWGHLFVDNNNVSDVREIFPALERKPKEEESK